MQVGGGVKASPMLRGGGAGEGEDAAATFPTGSLVFVPDAKQCFLAAQVVSGFRQGEEGKVELLVEEGEESGPITTLTLSAAQSAQCQAMDEQSLGPMENMVEFKTLNEASLLHNLRMRFAQDDIYTSIGDILVSVNPFKMMEDLYTPDAVNQYIRWGNAKAHAPPHVFAVADRAVRDMLQDRKPQSCIVSGESGAGKTEATKVFLQFIAEISMRNAAKANGGEAAMPSSQGNTTSLQDRILQVNPLLEAFGNAKTKRNDNSSRFGKYIQISFNPVLGTVVGGQMTSYLLEKSRVVYVAEGERNYHIFYQLVAGAAVDKQLRTKYMISNAPTDYFYLNQSSCVTIEEINDGRGWQQTVRAMEMIGISESKRKEIFVTLAGVLHLGNVAFQANTGGGAIGVSITEKTSLDSLNFAAQCLGFPTENLALALTKRDVSVRGEKIFKENTLVQAQMQRDALSKQIYSLLFDWLLVSMNKSLESGSNGNGGGGDSSGRIGILDIFGFESFQRNSFEQLCINFCNEKLQSHFNSFVFTLEQSQYQAEALDVSEIRFKDNAETVALLETRRTGLLSLLDEEGNMPNGSDVLFLKKVFDLKSPLIAKPDMNLIRHNPKEFTNVFILTHFAGPVCYNVEAFLEKNKDELAPELNALLQNTEREFILDLLPEDGAAAAGEKKKKTSLGSKFKLQLDHLMETLGQTQPHFIRCIKPNFEKVPDAFTAQMVLSQLRYSGLLEVCRIRQNGYPVQRSFADFQSRYALLVPGGSGGGKNLQQLVSALTTSGILPMSSAWQMGKTKMFLRNGVLAALEDARDAKLSKFALDIQRCARGYIARKQHKRHAAILRALSLAAAAEDEAKLEMALLQTGSLPYCGVHLRPVQDARSKLERIKARSRCLKQVAQATQSQDVNDLNVAIRLAQELGLEREPPVLEAKELVAFLVRAGEIKTSLRSAIQNRDLEAIQQISAAARAHVRANCAAIDLGEAEMMIERLLYIQTLVNDIAQLVQSKGDARKVMQLVTLLRESGGATNHPSVVLGEAYANEQAIVSAAHAKRVQETKQKIAESKNDLLNLIMLEMEAIQLGIDKDADLQQYWEMKAELERQSKLESELNLAAALLQGKDKTAFGEADIVAYETVLSKITWRDTEANKSLALLARKQLVARKRLDELMSTDAPVAGKEEEMKRAIKEAQSLGIHSETARKAQAMLSLKTIAAEEKKEMRRRSMHPTNANSGGLQSMLQSDPFFSSAAATIPEFDVPASRKPGGARPSLRPPLHRASIARGGAGAKPAALASNKKAMIKDGKARCLERMDVYQRNSAEWTAQCLEFANRTFQFENFDVLRTDEDFSAGEVDADRKLALVERKLVHTTQMIPKSLLDLGAEELNSEALNCFKSLLGWSLDVNAQFPQTLAVHFLKQGINTDLLTDELYAQLIKQLRKNAGKESVDRIWLLFCLACESFAPSREFLPYVVNFLMCPAPDCGDLIMNYTKWCLFQLCVTRALGKTEGQVPTVKYVSKFMARPPVILKIHLVHRVVVEAMSSIEVPVWPDQDVGFVEGIVCSIEGLPAATAKISGLFLKDVEKPRVLVVAPPPPAPSPSSKNSPGKSMRVDTSKLGNNMPAVPSPLAIKNRIISFVRSKPGKTGGGEGGEDAAARASSGGSGLLERRLSTASEATVGGGSALFASGRLSTISNKSDKFLSSAKSRFKNSKSFRILKTTNSTAAADEDVDIAASTEEALNAYIAVGGGDAGVVESSADGEGKAAEGKAKTAQQVSRIPPPPFAPWPLPRNFFPGDVFARLVSQDRLPFITFQKKLFVLDTEQNQATYIQIHQDVINNRLPLADFWQVLQLACISTIRAQMVRSSSGSVNIPDEQALVTAGFYSYIPMTWLSSTSYDWAGIAMQYLQDQGRVLLEMSEQELYGQYLSVCQTQSLFGAALFSVIHKNLTANLVCCLNALGLHILTNEASPITLGIVSFGEMKRFGASSTSVWVEVSQETFVRLPQLIEDDEGERHVLHLHTQQAREIYQLLSDYSYWFHHGFVREVD